MTLLDRLRANSTIARITERSSSRKPVEVKELIARRAAVALLLRLDPSGDQPEIFFIQRAHYETDPWSGQVAFPGGREEPGDASLLDTALRETLEETGIDVRRQGEVIGQLDDLRPQTVRLPPVVVRPYVALLDTNSEPVLSREVAASFWLPLRSLMDETAWRPATVTAGGRTLSRRAFHHGAFIVWGMTERILSGFLELVR